MRALGDRAARGDARRAPEATAPALSPWQSCRSRRAEERSGGDGSGLRWIEPGVIGAEASEDRWKSEAPNRGASRQYCADTSPLYSHLWLVPTGVKKTAARGLGDHEHAAASGWSCFRGETARGQSRRVRTVGLMWAVFVAGARRCQSVGGGIDELDALMVAFHQEWRGGQRGVSQARALQLAAVRVLKTAGFAHPFYWAAFILGGDGR